MSPPAYAFRIPNCGLPDVDELFVAERATDRMFFFHVKNRSYYAAPSLLPTVKFGGEHLSPLPWSYNGLPVWQGVAGTLLNCQFWDETRTYSSNGVFYVKGATGFEQEPIAVYDAANNTVVGDEYYVPYEGAPGQEYAGDYMAHGTSVALLAALADPATGVDIQYRLRDKREAVNQGDVGAYSPADEDEQEDTTEILNFSWPGLLRKKITGDDAVDRSIFGEYVGGETGNETVGAALGVPYWELDPAPPDGSVFSGRFHCLRAEDAAPTAYRWRNGAGCEISFYGREGWKSQDMGSDGLGVQGETVLALSGRPKVRSPVSATVVAPDDSALADYAMGHVQLVRSGYEAGTETRTIFVSDVPRWLN